MTQSFRPHYGSWVDSASKRNEYQEYFLGCKGDRCVGLTPLPPSCADYLEIWDPQTPGTLKACTAFALPFTFHNKLKEYRRIPLWSISTCKPVKYSRSSHIAFSLSTQYIDTNKTRVLSGSVKYLLMTHIWRHAAG